MSKLTIWKSILYIFSLLLVTGYPPELTAHDGPHLNPKKFLRKKGRILKLPSGATDHTLEQLKLPHFNRVKELILDQTAVTDAGMVHITHLKLDKLYLMDTKVGDRALDSIAKVKTLTQLSLKGTGVTDSGIAKLVDLPLKRIYLNDTAVTDVGIRRLKYFELDTLYMANTAVTDEGLAVVRGMPVVALNISGTKVSNESLPLLAELPLHKVYLKNSGITTRAALQLKEAGVLIDL